LSAELSTTRAAVVEALDDVLTLDAIRSPTEGDDPLSAAPGATPSALSAGIVARAADAPVV
jgi:hypothetical protein